MTRARSTSTKSYWRQRNGPRAERQSRATNLALCDGPQHLDHGELRVEVRGFLEQAHDDLHHLRDGLPELSVFLRELQHLLVQEPPVVGASTYRDDGEEQLRCRRKIGCLPPGSASFGPSRPLERVLTCRDSFSSASSFSIAAGTSV